MNRILTCVLIVLFPTCICLLAAFEFSIDAILRFFLSPRDIYLPFSFGKSRSESSMATCPGLDPHPPPSNIKNISVRQRRPRNTTVTSPPATKQLRPLAEASSRWHLPSVLALWWRWECVWMDCCPPPACIERSGRPLRAKGRISRGSCGGRRNVTPSGCCCTGGQSSLSNRRAKGKLGVEPKDEREQPRRQQNLGGHDRLFAVAAPNAAERTKGRRNPRGRGVQHRSHWSKCPGAPAVPSPRRGNDRHVAFRAK